MIGKILNVYAVVFQEDMLACALFDGREGEEAIAIVKPILKDGVPALDIDDPDGWERYKWLEKFGLLTEEALTELYKTVQAEDEQRQVYEELKRKYDAPREAQLVKKETELGVKEQDLKNWEGRLKVKEKELEIKEGL